tara:strand:+ start:1879 stop:2472 length:594 start_codon:yes stop_codon:yes gene_type:complete
MIDYEPIIAAGITAIATLASVLGGQFFFRNRREKTCVIKENAQNANVYTALKYVIEEMKGDRAYIMEFHNGDSYFSGRGQQKYSCTHEVVEEGISSECEFSQNHRISNYHNYINNLIKNESFIFKDCNKVMDKAFHQMLRRKGIKSIYNVPIKTLNGKIIGIMGIDYVKEPMKDSKDSKDSLSFMKRQARVVAGYLV